MRTFLRSIVCRCFFLSTQRRLWLSAIRAPSQIRNPTAWCSATACAGLMLVMWWSPFNLFAVVCRPRREAPATRVRANGAPAGRAPARTAAEPVNALRGGALGSYARNPRPAAGQRGKRVRPQKESETLIAPDSPSMPSSMAKARGPIERMGDGGGGADARTRQLQRGAKEGANSGETKGDG